MLSSNILAIPSQSVTSGATVESVPIKGTNLLSASAMIVSGSGAAGTLKFQCSNDDPTGGVAPANWKDIPSQTVAVTAAGIFLIPKFDTCYEWIKAIYISSGTGIVACRVKTLGM